jgi:hypothetical protein
MWVHVETPVTRILSSNLPIVEREGRVQKTVRTAPCPSGGQALWNNTSGGANTATGDGALYRASSNSIELRLRVEPDGAWLTIKRPGMEAEYLDIPEPDVAAALAGFEAIGEDPEKFKAFVSAAERKKRART